MNTTNNVIVSPKVKIKVFNDSWQFELVYDVSTTSKQQQEPLLKSPMLTTMEKEGKFELAQFPLTITTPATAGDLIECNLTLPNTACNIRVTCGKPTGGSLGTEVPRMQKVQHLTISNPLVKGAMVKAFRDMGKSTSGIIMGDVIGIYDDAVVVENPNGFVTNKATGENGGIAYLKTKDYIILGQTPKDKKIVFECGTLHPKQAQILIYFDIAFIYNATLEYNSLLDLKTGDSYNLVDNRGFFAPKPSLKDSVNNTGKNLLMACITEGNQKLRDQYNKSWFIDHTLTLGSISTKVSLGDVFGLLETAVVLKPNGNLHCDYISLDNDSSEITLVPGYNLNPTYRKLIKKVTLTSPDSGLNSSADEEHRSTRYSGKRSSGYVATVSSVRVERESSSPATSAAAPSSAIVGNNSEMESENEDSRIVDTGATSVAAKILPLYGTPLKAKRNLLSRLQNIHYRLGELEVTGKDLKICGWRFPSERLLQEYQKEKECDTCEIMNAIIFKDLNTFKGVKSGPLTTFDPFGTKIKVTDYPQRKTDVDGSNDEDCNEDSYYKSNDDIVVSSFNSGMVLHQTTTHFFLPSPEKLKVTKRLLKFSSSDKSHRGSDGKQSSASGLDKLKRKEEDSEDNVSVITATYEVNVRHGDVKKGQLLTDGESKLEPYLLVLVVNNATEVSVEYTSLSESNGNNKLTFHPFGNFLPSFKERSRKVLESKFAREYPLLENYRKELQHFFYETSYNMFNYNVDYDNGSGRSDNSNIGPFSDFVVCVIPIVKNDVLNVEVTLETIINRRINVVI